MGGRIRIFDFKMDSNPEPTETTYNAKLKYILYFCLKWLYHEIYVDRLKVVMLLKLSVALFYILTSSEVMQKSCPFDCQKATPTWKYL